MKIHLVLQFISLVLLLCATSSDALFFSYPKNVLSNFFKSLHEKKEVKESPPDIHHYHLHYYPVHVSSVHASVSSHKAPEKHELESLHTNKLESLGWGDQEYKYIPDPIIHHFPSFISPWIGSSHDSVDSEEPWAWEGESLDRHSRTGPGIMVRSPIHQRIIPHKPEKKEKSMEYLSRFVKKFRSLQNSLYHLDHGSHRKSDEASDKLNTFVLWNNIIPSRRM